MADEWLSLREFARRHSVALNAVQEAITSGRISAAAVRRDAAGRLVAVDEQRALVDLHENTSPSARTSKAWAATGGNEAAAEDDPSDPSYRASRAKRERHQADIAELDYLQRVGKLVDAGAVDREITESLTRVMTSVMRIADRKAQILAAETDPNRVHKILTAEFRAAFDECSRAFAAASKSGSE
ncbi:MAG: hypothetical protein JNL68_07750 [Burkholderiales bacterium]|nr:hypothetical protein [Burkholderiales bacterium]